LELLVNPERKPEIRKETPVRSITPDNSEAQGSTSAVRSRLKPSLPNDFDGDRTTGRAFLRSCELYIRLVPDQFPTEEIAVHWALSFMKSGRASTFAEQALVEEAVEGTPKFRTWLAFRTTFEEEFCPKNEAQLALAKLETTSYYQGRRTVDEYLDEFQELI